MGNFYFPQMEVQEKISFQAELPFQPLLSGHFQERLLFFYVFRRFLFAAIAHIRDAIFGRSSSVQQWLKV